MIYKRVIRNRIGNPYITPYYTPIAYSGITTKNSSICINCYIITNSWMTFNRRFGLTHT